MNFWDLGTLWYCVFIACIIGYTCLDGFDLGVGILHLWVKEDYQRRIFMNAIGPIWDGNAVWLIVTIGGLLAGFPYAYATLLSAFYTPITVFLAGIILRAVAIEFRSKKPSRAWRSLWDFLFSLGSLVIAFGAGLFLGNLINGIALDNNQVYTGSFWDFFTPYTVLVGIFGVATFTMHGALFLVLKTEGEIHEKLRSWVNPCVIFFIMTYAITTFMTLIYQPHMVEAIKERPILFFVALLNMFAIANIPREINLRHEGRAFLSSCAAIATLVILYGIGMFPTLVRSSIDPAINSLHIANSDASHMTLTILSIIVAIGIPLVVVYGFMLTKVFRGKVTIDPHSY